MKEQEPAPGIMTKIYTLFITIYRFIVAFFRNIFAKLTGAKNIKAKNENVIVATPAVSESSGNTAKSKETAKVIPQISNEEKLQKQWLEDHKKHHQKIQTK